MRCPMNNINETKDFLFELGCEELPTASLSTLRQELELSTKEELDREQLSFAKIHSFVTPRRLAVLVTQLAVITADRLLEREGPMMSQAYDQSGHPTFACLGFAKSCGVTIDELKVKDTPKGQRVYCSVAQPGKPTKELLSDMMHRIIGQLTIKKPMRWADHTFSFVRPVHWLTLLFGKEVIKTQLFDLVSSRETYGHRFHAPQALTLPEANRYEEVLHDSGFVVADYEVRKNKIRTLIDGVLTTGQQAVIDEALLDEVTALVEWPVVLQGHFKREFLSVPAEVLMTSMQVHQKCFPIVNDHQQLEPAFVVVSNIQSKDPKAVIRGNERVIQARLADAMFFFQNDCRHSLVSRFDKLHKVVFQSELGHLAAKTERLERVARYIAIQTGMDDQKTAQAAHLTKCDLLSEMVMEFPSLQGIMGYHYALNDQLGEECALAIKEHYLPRYAGDKLPSSAMGCCIAIADRLDTIVGILGINENPTGDKDPFALRRAALGILRILIEKSLPLDLMDLLNQALQAYAVTIQLPNSQVVADAFDFIMHRLKAWYADQGISSEVFAAVQACQPTQVLDFHHRIQAVREFQLLPEAAALAQANKRVSNILKKEAPDQVDQTILAIHPELFEHEAERVLAQALQQQTEKLAPLCEKGAYTEALTQLAALKQPIDQFFDQVMVVVEDKRLRNNRLALLATLRHLFTRVADISLLSN